jgi:N-acetylglutamate synthase
MDLDRVRACEERLVNVWPAVSTLLIEGWAVRFAHGYSGRANSASAIVPGAPLDDGLLGWIEGLYRDAGLPPTVRISPLAHADAELLLLRRGWRVKDEAATMLLSLAGRPAAADPRIRIEGAASRRWLAGVSARQEPSKRSADHLHAIVGALRLPAAFATLEIEGAAVGFAMGVLDRGYAEIGSVMLDAGWRGQGLGRALVDALLAWAADRRAAMAFLQVDVANAVALRLYGSQGFQELYRYRTLQTV